MSPEDQELLRKYGIEPINQPGYFEGRARRGGQTPEQQAAIAAGQVPKDSRPISFYYPSSGGVKTLPVGATEIDFNEGKVTTPNGTVEYLSSKLSGSTFSAVSALYINASKAFTINIDGIAELSVTKNFRKKHISIQRVVINCTVGTDILLWASTDPDAELEKDVTEVTIGGGVSPFGVVVDAGNEDADVNTWTTIVSRIPAPGKIYRLTKAQYQSGSAAWGCVLIGAATVAVFRVPDDGYFVDWYPYGDGYKLTQALNGSQVVAMKVRSKSSAVTGFGVLTGDES